MYCLNCRAWLPSLSGCRCQIVSEKKTKSKIINPEIEILQVTIEVLVIEQVITSSQLPNGQLSFPTGFQTIVMDHKLSASSETFHKDRTIYFNY